MAPSRYPSIDMPQLSTMYGRSPTGITVRRNGRRSTRRLCGSAARDLATSTTAPGRLAAKHQHAVGHGRRHALAGGQPGGGEGPRRHALARPPTGDIQR